MSIPRHEAKRTQKGGRKKGTHLFSDLASIQGCSAQTQRAGEISPARTLSGEQSPLVTCDLTGDNVAKIESFRHLTFGFEGTDAVLVDYQDDH